MKLQKSTLFIMGTASALLIAVVGMPDKASKEIMSVMSGVTPVTHDGASTVFTLGEEQRQVQRERSDALAWDRDPFSPLTSATPDAEPTAATSTAVAAPYLVTLPHLSGISIVGDSTLALLDGDVVQAGDRLPCGYTVKAIDRRTVTLSRGTRLETLTLGSDR
ncbi:MAG: hypothetical protein ACI8QZ_003463 [Chlamydiales bacterium]|jgi:hypothetical protein